MPGIKCPNPECQWEGNTPEHEFCVRCGAYLTAIRPDESTKVKMNVRASPTSPPAAKSTELKEPAVVQPTVAGAKLVVTHGGRIGYEFPINKESVSIGRWDAASEAYPEIDLTEDDPGCYVSRSHARILFKDREYFLEDSDSTNKTILNKVSLNPGSPQKLNNADEIIIGKTFLTFVKQ